MKLSDEDKAKVNDALAILGASLSSQERKTLDNPHDAVNYLRLLIGPRECETFVVLYLDSRFRLIECQEQATGEVDSTSASPRAIISHAIDNCARYIVVAHNHPSGDPKPSNADIDSTRRLGEAADLFGLGLLDHYVIGRAPGFPTYSIFKDKLLHIQAD